MQDTYEITTMPDGTPVSEDQEDVAGYASILGGLWSDIKLVGCFAGAGAAAISLGEGGDGLSDAADFCREQNPR